MVVPTVPISIDTKARLLSHWGTTVATSISFQGGWARKPLMG